MEPYSFRGGLSTIIDFFWIWIENFESLYIIEKLIMKTWTFYHEDMIIENRKFIVKNLLIEMKTASQSVQYWMGLKEQQNKITLYNQKGIKQSGYSGGVWTKWS